MSDNPFFTIPVHVAPNAIVEAPQPKKRAPGKPRSSRLSDDERRGAIVRYSETKVGRMERLTRIDYAVEDFLLNRMLGYLEGGWCQGFSGLSQDGRKVGYMHRDAVRFSLPGAFERARDTYLHENGIGFNRAWLYAAPMVKRIACAVGEYDIPEGKEWEWMRAYNDAPGRTQEEVVQLVRSALNCFAVIPAAVPQAWMGGFVR